MGTWSSSEIKMVTESYNDGFSIPQICQKMNRTDGSIRYIVYERLDLANRQKEWTLEEIQYLREKYCRIPTRQLAKTLKRSPARIRTKAGKLGIQIQPANISINICPELGTVLGVIMGDGTKPKEYQMKRQKQYPVQLRVKDKELVDLFNHAMAKVLHRRKLNKIHYIQGFWVVHYESKAFYEWFITADLVSVIKKFPIKFIRSFADCEGHSGYRVVSFTNSDKAILNLIKELMEDLGISCSRIRLFEKVGTTFKINGRVIKRRKNVYRFWITAENYDRYHRLIGFNLTRKRKPS